MVSTNHPNFAFLFLSVVKIFLKVGSCQNISESKKGAHALEDIVEVSVEDGYIFHLVWRRK